MVGLESAAKEASPHLVAVYGAENSGLAAAVVAPELRIPIAHMKLDSGALTDVRRSEDVNRVQSDDDSDFLFRGVSGPLTISDMNVYPRAGSIPLGTR